MESSRHHLKQAAATEQILLRDNRTSLPVTLADMDHRNAFPDQTAQSIISHVTPAGNHWKPVTVSGNGSCLFNAVSVLLFDDEVRSTELHVLCAIKLIMHGEVYVKAYPFSAICCIDETTTDCVKGGYLSAFTMAALATVI